MFKAIKEFFTGKSAVVETPVETAPYKVPDPAAVTPIPLGVTNSNPTDNVPSVAEVEKAVPVKKPRAPRAPAVKKVTVTKPAPAVKKPRGPKKTKPV